MTSSLSDKKKRMKKTFKVSSIFLTREKYFFIVLNEGAVGKIDRKNYATGLSDYEVFVTKNSLE